MDCQPCQGRHAAALPGSVVQNSARAGGWADAHRGFRSDTDPTAGRASPAMVTNRMRHKELGVAIAVQRPVAPGRRRSRRSRAASGPSGLARPDAGQAGFGRPGRDQVVEAVPVRAAASSVGTVHADSGHGVVVLLHAAGRTVLPIRSRPRALPPVGTAKDLASRPARSLSGAGIADLHGRVRCFTMATMADPRFRRPHHRLPSGCRR